MRLTKFARVFLNHHTPNSNHEVRLKEKDSSFVPNVGNLCPRPKNWTAVGFENYGAK